MGRRSISEAGPDAVGAGVPAPVIALWFSRPRAAGFAIICAAIAALGGYIARSFYLYPGQVVTGRGRGLLDAGHGTGGILIGLVMLGLGLWYVAHGLARLTTRQPALLIAEDGLHIDGILTRHAFIPWEAIERVSVQRVKVSRGNVLLPQRRDFRLAIVGKALGGGRIKTVYVARQDVTGGVRDLRQFARSATRALVNARS